MTEGANAIYILHRRHAPERRAKRTSDLDHFLQSVPRRFRCNSKVLRLTNANTLAHKQGDFEPKLWVLAAFGDGGAIIIHATWILSSGVDRTRIAKVDKPVLHEILQLLARTGLSITLQIYQIQWKNSSCKLTKALVLASFPINNEPVLLWSIERTDDFFLGLKLLVARVISKCYLRGCRSYATGSENANYLIRNCFLTPGFAALLVVVLSHCRKTWLESQQLAWRAAVSCRASSASASAPASSRSEIPEQKC